MPGGDHTNGQALPPAERRPAELLRRSPRSVAGKSAGVRGSVSDRFLVADTVPPRGRLRPGETNALLGDE